MLDRPLSGAIVGAVERIVDATRERDAATIRDFLGATVYLGGLWFDDATCREQFAAARELGAEEYDAFAGCLATLPLARSARTSETPDTVVLDYAPGFEIEANFLESKGTVTLTWIGYSGRRDANDTWPAISGSALELLREDGPRPITETDATASMSWLEVCLDEAGNVQAVVPRWTSSFEALDVAVTTAQQWAFRRFTVNDQPVAVCAMAAVAHPSGSDVAAAKLPISVPDEFSDAIALSPYALVEFRTEGEKNVRPSDDDKTAMWSSGDHGAANTWQMCVDTSGRVASITMIVASGYPGYDERVAKALAGWRYRPIELHGRPVSVCGVVTFIYVQRG